ncbi:double-strand break repair protein AddB [Salinarimonas ramus]|uniref:Double-strand break repair protein AddB n=1 Tax=Salinarimonas ramus TaxID=690164 RepID=A0A917QA22_9HYPH|nr:double-strand break repair protein AddB [Salinarimonas ramus]GGK39358.1 double-strand break repair protein AddB [Salinarimonas ramus]
MTRVFTIPLGLPFLETLADALVEGRLVPGYPETSGPEALAEATIFLPTRRAARALGALVAERAAARFETPALVLPRIVPLGAADDAELALAAGALETGAAAQALAPPIAPLERRLLLARLVQHWSEALDPRLARLDGDTPFLVPSSPADAVSLAGELEALMDDLAYENVPFEALGRAVDGDFSTYFELTLDFVRIAFTAWPAILAERGASDPGRRTAALIDAEAARLRTSPPRGPVIAAGSTGSIPATARLLAAIANLPRGAVVLPGLDRDLDEGAWRAVCGDRESGLSAAHGHPQAVMARLLSEVLHLRREDVLPLAEPEAAGRARERMLAEAMRPAETTEAWAALDADLRSTLAARGSEGIALVEAADERREALCVAIALRETLETPGRTAALVTPDRGLAERVCAELGRWGVSVDDSAGTSLAESQAGRLARLAAEAAADRFSPLSTLALLHHSAVRLGFDAVDMARARAALEIGVLRGPEPRAGIAGLRAALDLRRIETAREAGRVPRPRARLEDADWELAASLLARLEAAFATFGRDIGPREISLPALAAAHRAAFDALVAAPDREVDTDEDASEDEAALFTDGSDEALAELFDDLSLVDADAALRGVFLDYPGFFANVARDRRAPGRADRAHPRLKVLGLLEARLVRADRIVLAGLDEGVWPPRARTDAFLNRPMREEIGLPPPERRLGQTAHDFVQALGARDVVVTRAKKRDGAPTVPSRFLQRIRAFVGDAPWQDMLAGGARLSALADRLDAAEPAPPLPRPAPRPDPALFPRRLSVTEVETLVRDPYAIFARRVLGLDPLDAIATAPGAAERGSLIHDTFALFVEAHPDALPPRDVAAERLRQIGLDLFAPIGEAYPEVQAEWWPRFERVIDGFLDWEIDRRALLADLAVERSGKLPIQLGAETFLLTARADRIERRRDGGATIVDYKTGTPPSAKMVFAGFSPQLTLEAAMLRAGAFEGVQKAAGEVDLLYVHASGGKEPFRPCPIAPPKDEERTVADLVSEHLARLTGLVARFVAGEYGYVSRPYAQYALRFSAYDHLARVKEWSAAGGAGVEDET